MRTALVAAIAAILLAACGGNVDSLDAQSLTGVSQKALAQRKDLAAADSTPVFDGKRGDYTIVRTDSGYTITGSSGSTTAPLTTTKIEFSDFVVNLPIADQSQQISASDLTTLIELYVAYFNRAPDADGLSYWIEQVANGATLAQIGEQFWGAAVQYESLTGYSASMSNEQFVTRIYNNVLGRTPDAEGAAYWANELSTGRATRGALIQAILSSAHTFKGDSTWGWVADLLDNKAKVGAFFAISQGLNYKTPTESITKTMELVNAITPSSLQVAVKSLGFLDWTFGRSIKIASVDPTEFDVLIPALRLEQLTMSTAGMVNMKSAAGYTGDDVVWFNLLGTGDINGDGYEDLVIGLFRHSTVVSYSGRDFDPSGEIKPIILFYNPATDEYAPNAQLQSVVRMNIHPRQVAIADFDGDGRNDVFIGDHGYDDRPYGNQNTLLLNKSHGFVDGTSLLPQLADFSHGLIMADFDLNGRPDLLVMNNIVEALTKCERYPGFTECSYNPPKYSESYVLFNDGTSGLRKGTLPLSNTSLNFTPTPYDPNTRLYVGHSADFNRDGRADLVFSDNRSIFFVESSETTGFAPAQVFSVPSDFQCDGYTPYSAITSIDLDGDNQDEIIASLTCDSNTAHFRAFKRETSGIWADRSADLIGDQTANATSRWCYKFQVFDLNGDGRKDLICMSVDGFRNGENNVLWFGGSKLRFSNVTLQNSEWTNFETVVRGANGTYLIGLKELSGDLIVRRWKIR
jgi:hypothetical protein